MRCPLILRSCAGCGGSRPLGGPRSKVYAAAKSPQWMRPEIMAIARANAGEPGSAGEVGPADGQLVPSTLGDHLAGDQHHHHVRVGECGPLRG